MSASKYTNPADAEHYVHTWTTETDAVYPDGSHTNHLVLAAAGELVTLTVVNLLTSKVQTVEIVKVTSTLDGKQDIHYKFCDYVDSDDVDLCCLESAETWYKISAHFRLKKGTVKEVCVYYPITTRFDYTDDEEDYE